MEGTIKKVKELLKCIHYLNSSLKPWINRPTCNLINQIFFFWNSKAFGKPTIQRDEFHTGVESSICSSRLFDIKKKLYLSKFLEVLGTLLVFKKNISLT